jgi:hypothetical protein
MSAIDLRRTVLPPGVRPGHQQRPLARTHLEIERNHRDTLRQEQRVTAIAKRKSLDRLAELGLRALERDCITSAPVERVQHHECIERRHELIVQWTNSVRCLEQDAVDLSQLLDLELADAIAFLDRGRRLHEQRRPRT